MVLLIRTREAMKEDKYKKDQSNYNEPFLPYIDTLLDLQFPDEKSKLEETKIVTLCSEFFSAGNDTTSTALQWILGYLVKYPHIQEKLIMAIKGVIGERKLEIKEDDLQNVPYLKAMVFEGLRRHPPSHFQVPYAAMKDVELDGFLIPKNSIISFMVAEIGRDPKVLENPMEFKPERFLNSKNGETSDIIKSREIKMMPFGVGRKMCPRYSLALPHLEYFVADMVWKFKWTAHSKGNYVDLTEKHKFTTVMETSLEVRIISSKRISQRRMFS